MAATAITVELIIMKIAGAAAIRSDIVIPPPRLPDDISITAVLTARTKHIEANSHAVHLFKFAFAVSALVLLDNFI